MKKHILAISILYIASHGIIATESDPYLAMEDYIKAETQEIAEKYPDEFTTHLARHERNPRHRRSARNRRITRAHKEPRRPADRPKPKKETPSETSPQVIPTPPPMKEIICVISRRGIYPSWYETAQDTVRMLESGAHVRIKLYFRGRADSTKYARADEFMEKVEQELTGKGYEVNKESRWVHVYSK